MRQTGQWPGCGPRGRRRGHLRVYGRYGVFPRVGKHGPFHVGVLHLHHKAPGDPRALLNPGARLEVLILPGRKGERSSGHLHFPPPTTRRFPAAHDSQDLSSPSRQPCGEGPVSPRLGGEPPAGRSQDMYPSSLNC